MNVLIIGPDKCAKGGIATVINNFYTGFSDKLIKTHYLFSWKESGNINNIITFIYCIVKLPYLLIKYNIKVVHIHVAQGGSFYRKSIFSIISKMMGKKVIFHIHASQFDKFYEKNCSIVKKIIKILLNISDLIVVLSEEWKMIIETISERNDILVVENAVTVHENNKYNNNGKNITFFGRIGYRKGIYDLLDICECIFRKYPEYKLIICGDGEIESAQEIIKTKNLNSNVVIKGWVNGYEKEDILRETIINILPSYNEGMPMAILETMGYGIPNISTNVGGIGKVVIDNYNGYIINPGDKNALLEKINNMIGDSEKRRKLSENSFITIKEQYDIDVYFSKWKKIYTSI